jgi:quinol monooxygenase YgiN
MVWEVMEAFRDRASFDAHQARTRASAWFTATRGILRDFRMEEVGD